jgi:PAS domain S-box-containing protein
MSPFKSGDGSARHPLVGSVLAAVVVVSLALAVGTVVLEGSPVLALETVTRVAGWASSVVVVGLLGLAAGPNSERPVRALTEKLRRYIAGEEVDFSTERTDSIGTLSRTLGELVGELDRVGDSAEHGAQCSSLTAEVLDTSDVGTFVLDAEFRVVWVNTAVEAFFGIDRETAVGSGKRELLDEIQTVFAAPDTFAETVRATYDDNSYAEEFECHVLADGDGDREERWLRHWSQPIESGPYAGGRIEHYTDITDRKAREEELERTTDLLKQAQHLARIGGWEMVLTTDDWRVTWTDELYDLLDAAPETALDMETGVQYAHPDDRELIRDAAERSLATGEGSEIEFRCLTGSGDVFWARQITEVVAEGGDVVALRGSIQDISEQKEHEHALTSLHEVARQLLTTESQQGVADLAVDTAVDVLDTPAVAVYSLTSTASELTPTAVTPGFAERCGGTPSVPVGTTESPLWNTFVSGDPAVFEAVDATQSSLFDEGVAWELLIPLGTHGMFVVLADPSGLGTERRRLVETLAATTEAAFDRLASEADLRERDAELEAKNDRLQRHVHINEIIRSIDQSLIDATSRAEIETTVCERLVGGSGFAFAWIGVLDAGGETIVPRAWAGNGEGYLDAVGFSDSSTEPSWRMISTGASAVVPNVAQQLQHTAWASEALSRTLQSAVSVPVALDEYTYGVLSVYADTPNVFGDLERTVFEELGEGIAHAINAVETRQALYSETVLELELTVDSEEVFLGALAQDTGATVEFEGLSTLGDSGTHVFFRTSGASREAVESALAGRRSVTAYDCVKGEGTEHLFDAAVSGPLLAAKLVRHGGRPATIRADAAETTVVVDLPQTTDVREFLEMLETQYPSVGLRTRRTVDRAAPVGANEPSVLLDRLTERQQEVLRTAYLTGFFEVPRETSAKELAEMLGVSQPTVSHHLRNAQHRLLSTVFERERGRSG